MTVIETINEGYLGFSKSQKRIADFIINNTDKACFLSLKEMSEEIGVTEVTVINFSKKLGYESFSEFKRELQSYIQMVLSPSAKIVNAVKDSKDRDSKLLDVIQLDGECLNSTMQGINIDDINKAVELIKQARRIHLVGESMSEVVADFLTLRMNMLGLDAVKFDISSYERMSISMLKVDPRDVFITIIFPVYSKKIKVLSEYLSEKDIKIINITDKNTSPVARYSEVVFTCATETLVFYNSMTAPIALSNLLVSALALDMKDALVENKEKTKAAKERLYEILDKQNKHAY